MIWLEEKKIPYTDNKEQEHISLLSTQTLTYQFQQYRDARDDEGLLVKLCLPDERPVTLTVDIMPAQIGRKEFIEKTSTSLTIQGKGWKTVRLAFSQFDYDHAAGSFWRFLDSFSIQYTFAATDQVGEVLMQKPVIGPFSSITAKAPVVSKSGSSGESVTYEVNITNQTNQSTIVAIGQQRHGKESMKLCLEESLLHLDAHETRRFSVNVFIGEHIAPGGFEKQVVTFTPDGQGHERQKITFITSRMLPHPYILHNQNGWEDIKGKCRNHDWAHEKAEQFIRTAEEWIVPEPQGERYVFETSERHNLMAAAIAWQLTDNLKYAEKAASFLRKLADPETGYESVETPLFFFIESESEYDRGCPMMHMACNQGLVQEAEFFRDMAAGYDLICRSGILRQTDHKQIERVFRLYMEFADYLLQDGDGNNFQLAEMTAGLFCASALQDRYWINRFIYGYSGYQELLGSTLLDDGWYFELATGYISLAAELFTEAIQAAAPWGINLADMQVPADYHSHFYLAPWSKKPDKPFLGMSCERWNHHTHPYRTVKMMFDAMVPYVDEKGFMFGMNDGKEKSFIEVFERAYFLFGDERYVQIIKRGRERGSLLYSAAELPKTEVLPLGSVNSSHAGFALLREQGLEALLKYGMHGGYHGHFDRLSLLSLKKDGQELGNPLAAWYGYDSYLFKMWVQTSLAHNMVTVDQKMQEPTESTCLLFEQQDQLHVAAAETVARWSDPPYGGQTPYIASFPEEKGFQEGRSIPLLAENRKQGEIGEYSEPILQRRLIASTAQYVVVADYIEAESEHEYDCLFHFNGLTDTPPPGIHYVRHTGQMNTDAKGSGQFITNCDWHETEAPYCLTFHSEELSVNVHQVYPKQGMLMTADFPENRRQHKQVRYEVLGDGKVIQQGRSGIWLLGKIVMELEVKDIEQLEVRLFVDKQEPEAPKTLFLGNAYFIDEAGTRQYVYDLPYTAENVEEGHGKGVNYYGNDVVIEGIHDGRALPFEPEDPQAPASIKVNVPPGKCLRFTGEIGGDFLMGNHPERRRTISFRQTGRSASFITVLEPFKGKSRIRTAQADEKGNICIELEDGTRQTLSITGLSEGTPRVVMTENEGN